MQREAGDDAGTEVRHQEADSGPTDRRSEKPERSPEEMREDQSPRRDRQHEGDRTDDSKDGREHRTRRWPLIILAIVVLLAIIAGVVYWLMTRGLESTDDAYTEGNAIAFAAKVSGYVTQLNIDDNTPVKTGDLLLKIDPRDYTTARDQARASLSLARAQLASAQVDLEITRVRAPATLLQAQAQLAQAKANQDQAQREYTRQHSVDPRATTQTNIDQANAQLKSNAALVSSAQAQVQIASLVQQTIQASEDTVREREAQVAQAEANVAQADVNLSYTELRAPQDGYITRRNVDLGTFVQAGQQVFYIVTPQVWVTANFKETQLADMRPGQPVAMSVDAYPTLRLHGHVDSIQQGSGARFSAFPAENATGNFVKIVRRVPVKVIIDSGLENHPDLPRGFPVGNLGDADGNSAVSGTQQGWKPRSNPWLVAIVVTLGAFMEVLDTTIVNVSLPHIAGSLSVSSDESAWALTTYLVANGIVLTISGALSRRIGRKRYFMICIGAFTAASLACGVTEQFSQLLLFRALQGFFGGGLQPTQQAIILDHFPPEKRQQAFSLTAIAIIIAPVVGPVLGGYLTDTYSWHWIFLINVPIGIMTLFGVMQFVEDPPSVQRDKATAPRFDYFGVVFISLALGCLELGVDRGEDYDWLGSTFIRVMFLLSVCGFVFGITYLLYVRNPIVNLRVFKDRNFALGTLQIGIMGFVLYASAVLIPQFAQEQLAYTATWAGLVLAPGAIVLVILIPIVGRILSLIPTKYVIASGGLALGLALLYSMNLVPELDFWHLVKFRAAQTAALALLFVPISTIAYATIPASMNGDAAALFSMARNVFGGIGISVSTALVTEHLQVNQTYLIANLTPTNQPYNFLLQQVQQALIDAGQSMAQAVQAAPGQIYQMLQGQVAVLAYNDVFLITACLSFVMIPTALLLSGGKTKSAGGGAG